MPQSPTIALVLDSAGVTASVLAVVNRFNTVGYAALRSAVAAQRPVVEVELFTHDFFEGGGDALLRLVRSLIEQGVRFELHELHGGDTLDTADLERTRISPEMLENTVSAA